jgi:hypothetical protein
MSRFVARSGGGELGLGRLGWHEACIRSSAAADADLFAGGGAFEVVAEVVAQLVATDVDCARNGSGAEGTRTPGPHDAIVVLFQLSYSPSELKLQTLG